jgi:capsular polysaccharide biosynthesis protein
MSMSSIGWEGIAGSFARIRRYMWLLPMTMVTLAGLFLGREAAARQPILYEGVVRVLFAEPTSPGEGVRSADPNRVVRNQAVVLSSTPVLEDAARRHGGGMTVGALRGRVVVDTSTESNLMTIRVLDSTPRGAARLADSVLRAYDERVHGQFSAAAGGTGERLEQRKAALQARLERLVAGQSREDPEDPALRAEVAAIRGELQRVVARQLQVATVQNAPGFAIGAGTSAEVSEDPVQPKPKRSMAIGALLGLAVGTAVAWLLTAGRRIIAAVLNEPTRPFRWFIPLLGLLLVGYMFFSKVFAYLVRVPGTPAFAGEIVLAVGVVECVRARSLVRQLLKASAVLKVLLVLMAVSGVRVLWDFPTYGIDAIRDYSVLYYGVFAFLVATAAIADPTFIPRMLKWYRRILPWFLLWVPIAIFLARYSPLAAINIPGSTTAINTFKGSDYAIMTTMGMVFLWTGLGRDPEAEPGWRSSSQLTVLGVFSLLVLGSQGRATLLMIPVVFGTALYFLPNNGRRRIVLTLLGGVALVLVPILLLNLQIQLGARDLSLQQVGENVASIVSRNPQRDEATTGLQGTVKWRQDLFGRVLQNTLTSDQALTGRGFGPILSYDFLEPEPQTPGSASPPPLRSAHNSHITLLVRAGLLGFGLWVLLWVLWFRDVGRAARLARQGPSNSAGGVAVWLLAGVVGLLFMSFNDPTLETPQGAIWLWSMVGLAVAQGFTARLADDGSGVERPTREAPRAIVPS